MPRSIALPIFSLSIGQYPMIPIMIITNRFITYEILMAEGLFKFFEFEVLSFGVVTALSL